MTWVPKVGDRVKLSRYGYKALQLDNEEAIEASRSLVITGVEQIGEAHDPIYDIQVDAPSINIFLLEASMLTLITGDKS